MTDKYVLRQRGLGGQGGAPSVDVELLRATDNALIAGWARLPPDRMELLRELVDDANIGGSMDRAPFAPPEYTQGGAPSQSTVAPLTLDEVMRRGQPGQANPPPAGPPQANTTLTIPDQIEQLRAYLSAKLDELAVASKSLRDELRAAVVRASPHRVYPDPARDELIPVEVLRGAVALVVAMGHSPGGGNADVDVTVGAAARYLTELYTDVPTREGTDAPHSASMGE